MTASVIGLSGSPNTASRSRALLEPALAEMERFAEEVIPLVNEPSTVQ